MTLSKFCRITALIVAFTLCTGVSVYASVGADFTVEVSEDTDADIGAKSIESMIVSASWLDDEMLRIDVLNAQTGSVSSLAVRISDFVDDAGNSPHILIQAVDLDGNLSGIVRINNPFYAPAESDTEESGHEATPPDSEYEADDNYADPPQLGLTPDGTGTVVDNATNQDGIEFFTVFTEDGNEFFLVVDRQRNTDNVYLLNAVTEEHLSEDGYFGTLSLDISSIEIESQGTTSSSHTARRTREFPHLSNADTSLVPRTITENGRTYNLANVEWRTQSSTAVDYRQIASAFTAVATYTRTATSVSTIGYTTTAKYRGSVSRVAAGRTEFTAHFIGIPIVAGTVSVTPGDVDVAGDADTQQQVPTSTHTSAPESTSTPEPIATTPAFDVVSVEQVHIGGIIIETEQTPTPQVVEEPQEHEQERESRGLPLGYVAVALMFVASVVLAYFVGKKGIAMLAVLKRVSCVIVATVMVMGMSLGMSQTALAAELPSFGFGRSDVVNAVHFNNSTPTAQSASLAATQSAGVAVHFDPRRSDVVPMSANITLTSPGNAPRADPNAHSTLINTSVHNYGDNIGVLTVERLGRTVNVIAGATMTAMDHGAAHFSFTGLNSGNTALIGHNRGRTNGFFDFVRHLREGDILTLEAGGITKRYAVTMLHVIDYTDFSPLMNFGDNRLTLITCVEYRQNQRRVAAAVEII